MGVLYQASDNFRLGFNIFSSQFDEGIDLYPLFDLLALEAEQGSHPQVRRDGLGARNILNKLPPSSVDLGFPYYQTRSGDITERIPYIRYSQSF